MTAGETFKFWRDEAGLTQPELAAKATVSISTIQKLEGGTFLPERPTLRLICEALGKGLADFDRMGGMSCLIVRSDAAKAFRDFCATIPDLDESEILRQVFTPALRMTPQKLKDAYKARLARKDREAATSKSTDQAIEDNPKPRPIAGTIPSEPAKKRRDGGRRKID